jgi:Tn3 transposase DDE domain
VATLGLGADVPVHLLAHLSPLGWKHVNLAGDYVLGNQQSMRIETPPPTFRCIRKSRLMFLICLLMRTRRPFR